MKPGPLHLILLACSFPQFSDAEQDKVLLRRSWESGMEYAYRSEMRLRNESRPGGDLLNWARHDYVFCVWPGLETEGQRFGLQWSEYATSATAGGVVDAFDSTDPKVGGKMRQAFAGMWEMFEKSWIYFGEDGGFLGKTGAGWANGAVAISGIPNPYGALSERPDVNVLQKVTAAANLPKEPVAPGHRWQAKIQGSLLQQSESEATLDCGFREIAAKNGHHCAVIDFNGTFRLLPREDPETRKLIELPALLDPVVKGEIWLDVATGVTVFETYSYSYGNPVGAKNYSLKSFGTASMELISQKPIDPGAPLPLPLQAKPNTVPTPSISADIAVPDGAFILQIKPQIDTRYVWSSRNTIDDKMEMAAMKGMKPMPPMRVDHEQIDEERVTANGPDGGTRHDVRLLRTINRAPGKDGAVVFDSDKIRDDGDMDYRSSVALWENSRQTSQVALRDANGTETKRWSIDHRAGDKISEFPSFQTKGFEEEFLMTGKLSAIPRVSGETWPFECQTDSLGIADSVTFRGECRFVSLGNHEAKRLATVEVHGSIGHVEGARPAKVGMGELTQGSFKFRVVIDVDARTLVELSRELTTESNLVMPGTKSKLKKTSKHGFTRKLVSMESLKK